MKKLPTLLALIIVLAALTIHTPSAHAAFGFSCTSETRDKETGCCYIAEDYQACKQAFYLKQQNQILQKNSAKFTDSTSGCTTSTQEGLDYCKQLSDKKTENEQLKSQLVRVGEVSTENAVLSEKVQQLMKDKEVLAKQIRTKNQERGILIGVIIILVATLAMKIAKRKSL